jgi:hypothetical protein
LVPQVVQTWFAQTPLQQSMKDWQACPPSLHEPPALVVVVLEVEVVAPLLDAWALVPVDVVAPPGPVTPDVTFVEKPAPTPVGSTWWEQAATPARPAKATVSHRTCITIHLELQGSRAIRWGGSTSAQPALCAGEL